MSDTDDILFDNYFADNTIDEMLSPDKEVHQTWKTFLANINNLGIEELASRQDELNWYLAENGVTYNVYNDPQGLNRPWNLNVIPCIVHEKEWRIIEKGIKQRAELLNLILKDIFGKRELISNGIIPQEVIYGHNGFIRQCDQVNYNTIKHLLVVATDITRGHDGRMWVIGDKTQAPSGMGYALENRLTMGRVSPDLFKGMNVKRLYQFFQQFHDLLIDSSPGKKDNPNIVVLTPGPHSETYFEHAYLASFLGYSLVQGNDLIVRNGYLWMKSLKGLKQVDVVLRRVDDMYTDPLELREDSHLGVPGLLDVVHRQNVTIVNPIGSMAIENPGLMPFLPAIARYFLNEDLILPQIASWWCGKENEMKYVLDNLSNLTVTLIKSFSAETQFVGQQMSNSELDELRRQISERPYRFVAQETINFSTTPSFVNGQFEPHSMVWRTFTIANKEKYSVMPGGLIRVTPGKGKSLMSYEKGGASKDIWITSDKEDKSRKISSMYRKSAVAVSGLDDLPSLTAENLFWAGRYVGRTLSTARFIRMVLKQMTYIHFDERKPNSESLQLLFQAVTQLTYTFPGFVGGHQQYNSIDPYAEIRSVVTDKNRVGSLAYTISLFSNSYYSIRNLWSNDMWRVFERIETIWKRLETDPNISLRKMIQALDQIITRLIAFMGLVEESILIEQGLLMYFIGLQLEQSMLDISKYRTLLVPKQVDQVEYEILESLLNSHESLNIYRYSFRSYITLENVINLILLDPKYPRSLAYRLNRLNKDLALLPQSRTSIELTDYERSVFEAYSKIRLVKSCELIDPNEERVIRDRLDKLLAKLSKLLHKTSLAITSTYFSHTYKQNQLVMQNFSD